MKKIILITISLFLFNASIKAQCVADAGIDTIVWCSNAFNPSDTLPTILGGNPSASFGTPPYSYTWYISEPYDPVPGSTLIFYASDFLSDTTISNPILINCCSPKSMKFYLKITDSVGCTSVDSCLVLFSSFIHHLGYWSVCIWKGDSVYLEQGSNIGGGIGGLSYLWRPNHGLTDSTSLEFWSKPNSSIAYYVTVTDSVGCVGIASPLYYVCVLNVGINEQPKTKNINVYPNPAKNFIFIDNPNNIIIRKVTLIDIQGKEIKKIEGNINKLNVSDVSSGQYFLKLETEKGELIRKIIIE